MELEQLVRPTPARKSKELGEVADVSPGFNGSCRSADDMCLTRSRTNESARDLDEGRLAGTVRPEKAHELSLVERQVDVDECLCGAVALLERPSGEGGRHDSSLRKPPGHPGVIPGRHLSIS